MEENKNEPEHGIKSAYYSTLPVILCVIECLCGKQCNGDNLPIETTVNNNGCPTICKAHGPVCVIEKSKGIVVGSDRNSLQGSLYAVIYLGGDYSHAHYLSIDFPSRRMSLLLAGGTYDAAILHATGAKVST